MIGKNFIRLVGVLTCVAVVATGWDAEAGHRRHHRRSSCCCYTPVYETVCEPVCAPACESACQPACVTAYNPCCEVVTACCRPTWSYTVVSREVVIPAPSCCDGRIAAAERPTTGEQLSAAKPAGEPVPAATASGSAALPSVVKTSAAAR